MAFENPCDKCEKAKNGEDCTTFQKCKDYRYWLNYNFKMARINARKRKEEMPKVRKKSGVVLYWMGRPGTFSRPASSINFLFSNAEME